MKTITPAVPRRYKTSEKINSGLNRCLPGTNHWYSKPCVKPKHPVGAYELLDQLREHGLRAPLQIYRTLDQLIELKIVHRLEV